MDSRRDRLSLLRSKMKKCSIDYVVLVPGANMQYLTGINIQHTKRSTFVIIDHSKLTLICPSFERERLTQDTYFDSVHTYTDSEGVEPALTATGALPETIALEYQSMLLGEAKLLESTIPRFKLQDVDPLITSLRIQKDNEEIAWLKVATQAASTMLEAIRHTLAPGVTEKQLRRAALEALESHHPECSPGVVLVVSGARCSLPHAGTTDRAIEDGEPVMVDLGARFNGYLSDVTRTFAVGRLSETMNRAYDAVLRANKVGTCAPKIGMTASELDAVVRRQIELSGLGEFFTHRTGHGLGLEVHEAPSIVEGNSYRLQAGNVFTIEPGVYISGFGGVRIEDDVLLTVEGPRILTDYPRDLRS